MIQVPVIVLLTRMAKKMARMATIWPQWMATFLATGVWNEPSIKHRVNHLATVAPVLPGTVFLTILTTTLWTRNTK